MSLSMDRSTALRLTKEISDLRAKEAGEVKKEADASKKANAAQASASRSSSASSAKNYMSTAAREVKNAEDAQGRRARYSADIAKKSQELSRLQERISRAEESERKAAAAADQKRRRDDEKARKDASAATNRLRRDYEARVAGLEAQLAAQVDTTTPFQITAPQGEEEPYDLFISHATKDKADFVDELAAKARAAGLRVWYDQFRLGWGARVRREIDKGLRNSYFGVVVLSPNFFNRSWPEYELDGLIQKDLAEEGRLLPIWHRLTHGDILKYAPSLADRMAMNSATDPIDTMVEELVEMRDNLKAVAQPG